MTCDLWSKVNIWIGELNVWIAKLNIRIAELNVWITDYWIEYLQHCQIEYFNCPIESLNGMFEFWH